MGNPFVYWYDHVIEIGNPVIDINDPVIEIGNPVIEMSNPIIEINNRRTVNNSTIRVRLRHKPRQPLPLLPRSLLDADGWIPTIGEPMLQD